MGCNSCKQKEKLKFSGEKVNINQEPLFMRGLIFVVKILLFAISLVIAIPIVIPFTVYMLFRVIFTNHSVDVTSGLVNVGKLLIKKDRDDEDEDGEDLNDYEEDELELMDVEDISKEKNV